MQRRIRRTVKGGSGGTVVARTFSPEIGAEPAHSTSRQVEYTDEFSALYSTMGAVLLAPPYDPARLYEVYEQSNMLPQCIEAFVTNTVGTGWEPEPTKRGVTMETSEQEELLSFVENANADESLASVMSQVIRDREIVGYGFLEVVRDAVSRVAILRHAKSMSTRLTAKHLDPVLVTYNMQRGGRVSRVSEHVRFRRYVQRVGGTVVWFKEYGDPRSLDRVTGSFEGEAGYVRGRDATEILHFRLPSNDAYGTPRWISQLPSMLGSREAEEGNLSYFRDNTVPPMMLSVSGGRLTAQSYRELQNMVNSGVGRERQHKIALVEAVGEADNLDGKASNVQIRVDKLTDARQNDGLFSTYDKDNQAKIRSSYRLPGVAVGYSQDVTFATANVSAFIAETQVYAPARTEIDEVLDKKLIRGLRGLALTSAKLVGRTPVISTPDMVVRTLTALNTMGAITPRIARSACNKMLQNELPEFPQKGAADYEEWMDKPIVFVTSGSRTQAEQGQKTDEIKALEDSGDINPPQPEHGQE